MQWMYIVDQQMKVQNIQVPRTYQWGFPYLKITLKKNNIGQVKDVWYKYATKGCYNIYFHCTIIVAKEFT